MRRFLEKIGEVGEAMTLKVSKRGDGVSVYLPAKTVQAHDIRPGDYLKVKLLDLFREKEE